MLYRIMIASVVGFLISIFLLGLGSGFGKALGLPDNRNAGEVVLSFLAGGLVVLIYKDRIDTRKGG